MNIVSSTNNLYKNVGSANKINDSNNYRYNNLKPLSKDTVSFTGAQPYQYNDIFQYFASEILKTKNCKGNISPKKIGSIMSSYKPYGNYVQADENKIKWKSYITKGERRGGVRLVNESRNARLDEWKNFLEGTNKNSLSELMQSIKNQENVKFDSEITSETIAALKILIWEAVNSELAVNNRHIPAPVNNEALKSTIEHFLNINKKDIPRKNAADCAHSFINMYSNCLIQGVLDKKGIEPECQETWIKIPSKKHDIKSFRKNINDVEILSHKNWCTRSSVDKAQAALETGDFHVFVKKNPRTNLWESKIGMVCCGGKLQQIQSEHNDYIIPPEMLGTIKDYVSQSNLEYSYNINEDFPEAGMQVLIAEKLTEKSNEIGKSFADAINEKDSSAIYRYTNQKGFKVRDDGYFEIQTYKPIYTFDNKGHNIPYSFFGIDEDELLKNVKKIDGDLYLSKAGKIFCQSQITKFPENLEEVTGRIHCTKEQYDKYKENIDRVLENSKFSSYKVKIVK